ncbi:serine/threonine protein kinase [Allomyces macrogynus ATCC 38327]|uniref:Serine/threonine protein kinase n=1 Tax=Allomyces macrogynus (strain ATCC 38327) TaxID=578462 RepID=A0A0L0TC25_ALLM3|nr:serine/threonine protein kinase [Allomyces macrogynus ATCC 38327]|eukprot:KNE72255.1 serine/threonine protein kinase [Allomyces macrogynus ATCC 38327]
MFQRPRRDSGNRSRESTTSAPVSTDASASPSLPPAMPPALPLARVATTHSTADSASTRAKRTGLLARFSWRKLKAGITGGQHTVAKESSTARVVVSAPLTAAPIHESHGLSPVREVSTPPIPIPGSSSGDADFNSTVVASTPPTGGGALVYKTLFKGAPGDDSASVSTATLTATDQPSSKPAAHGEVAILAMIAAAKDANTDASRAADWTHVVSPRDVLVDDVGRDVVVFDAYTHLNLSDVPLRAAADLVRQLLSALDAIHALGIVHLDVNPANLMQDAAGRLVLIDFGLARVCDGTPHPPGRGTRGYIAPELFPPKMCTSTYPDLYSAGIVFGQLLEPYLVHCNLRILGGSASYPVHVEEVWQDVREFVEIDALCHDDLFPPILQLAADLLLRLITSSTPSTPAPGHLYVRLSAPNARRHPFLAILDDPPLADASFRYMAPNEWRQRRAGDQLRDRKRRRGTEYSRLIGA